MHSASCFFSLVLQYIAWMNLRSSKRTIKSLGYFIGLLLLQTPLYAQQTTAIQVNISLDKVAMDRVPVEIFFYGTFPDTLLFRLPKVVPGTYAIYDFGRFVVDFTAFDKTGKPINFYKSDINTWELVGANQLHKIKYTVDDTWDAPAEENFVFNAAGTNIEEDKNFLFNTQGFVGYLEGYTGLKYEVTFLKPLHFHGSTALRPVKYDSVSEVYALRNYHELIDHPIMFCVPDTQTLMIGNTEILVSVFAQGGRVTSAFVANQVKNTLEAQKRYLGDTLPVSRYAFLMYFFRDFSASESYGALEHTTSSVYFMPEMDTTALAPELKSIASHEFFHIVTPLTLKSEEIAFFDYHNPSMSQHLWLYEGVVEYFSHHMQVEQGLTTPEEFLEEMTDKLYISDDFNDQLPFTELSKNCLTVYQKEYDNVYYKGALIAMCLDLSLRYHTEGKQTLNKLVMQLGKLYGADRPFKDEEFFDVFVEKTHPEIKVFIEKYIQSADPLPLKECLSWLGIEFLKDVKVKDFSIGGIQIGLDSKNMRLLVQSTEELDDFGRTMGYQEGDVFVKINGINIDAYNYQDVFSLVFNEIEEGDKLSIIVLRPNKKGKLVEKKLKAKMQMVDVVRKYLIKPMTEKPSAEQLRFYESYFNPSN